MRQLDFSDYKPYCTDDRAERFDAFWGPLDETRRSIAMVARDFFTFADEANRQMRQRYNLEGCDPKKSEEAFHRAQLYAKVALESFYAFGRCVGCKDQAETIEHLNLLVQHAENCRWRIVPNWWLSDPNKNTAYYINQFRIHAGEYDRYLEIRRNLAEENNAPKAKGRRKEVV